MLLDWAEAIASRGNAKPGYKTMLDAIYPAANAYQKSLNEGNDIADCLHKMVMAAKQGADSTREMEAVKEGQVIGKINQWGIWIQVL